MNLMRHILLRMFGRPQGVLGRLGGIIMARANEKCVTWVIELLEIGPRERVLEVGFGPGVVIQRLAALAEHAPNRVRAFPAERTPCTICATLYP